MLHHVLQCFPSRAREQSALHSITQIPSSWVVSREAIRLNSTITLDVFLERALASAEFIPGFIEFGFKCSALNSEF